MKNRPEFTIWSIRWGHPNRTPPDGKPKCLGQKVVRYDGPWGHTCPPELEGLKQLGDGYSLTVTFVSKPPRMLPEQALASVRLKRLRRRVEAKCPLFAEQIIADEIASNPDYYAGVTRPDLLAQHQAIVDAEREAYDRYCREITE